MPILIYARTSEIKITTIKGFVIVSPHTLYKQKVFIQSDAGNTIELYNVKGIFPKLSFGDYVSAEGILSQDQEPPRLKVVSKTDMKVLASDKTVTYASITLAVLDPDAALSLIQVEGEITRYSKKSLQLTDQDSQATIRMMQNSKLFPKSMLKGSHVRVLGFLRYESAGPAIYIPDFEHIEVLSSPQVSTIPTTTPSERIIEGAVSDTSFNQWYVVFAVPLVLLAGFAVKKYIVPRMG